jgi:molybdopterin molybdotransferase
MKEFFTVTDIKDVFAYLPDFRVVETEPVGILESPGRVMAADIMADLDIPDFARSTMDGYAVFAASTFGASEANPAYLTITGAVAMGDTPPDRFKRAKPCAFPPAE